MKYAVFPGPDGRTLYVNPRTVTYVREVNEKSCLIYFGPNHAIGIPMRADLVVADIEAAASK